MAAPTSHLGSQRESFLQSSLHSQTGLALPCKTGHTSQTRALPEGYSGSWLGSFSCGPPSLPLLSSSDCPFPRPGWELSLLSILGASNSLLVKSLLAEENLFSLVSPGSRPGERGLNAGSLFGRCRKHWLGEWRSEKGKRRQLIKSV